MTSRSTSRPGKAERAAQKHAAELARAVLDGHQAAARQLAEKVEAEAERLAKLSRR